MQGPNRLPREKGLNRWKLLRHQFTSLLVVLLLAAGGVSLALGEVIDAGVIFFIVLINAAIGFVQEVRAEKSVRALQEMVVPRATVVRGGREEEIGSEELVPGDVVLLTSGNRVPADLRLLHALHLRTVEAALTGESVPAEKETEALGAEGLVHGDQRNMAFMGTVVAAGRGRGVVVRTGADTVLGGIATEVGEIGSARAPLQIRIDRFSRTLGALVLAGCGLLFAMGWLAGESPRLMLLTAVAAAVAIIPEGLPIVVTIALSVGVARMAARNAIIRHLPAVETIGSVTVIGSDKTGTLTRNEMTVRRILAGGKLYSVTGDGYGGEGLVLPEKGEGAPGAAALRLALRIGLLCNESELVAGPGGVEVRGDPTEGALIASAARGGLDLGNERAKYPRVAILPFESERGFMATLHRGERETLAFVKGAPEKVLAMCGGDQEASETARRFAKEGLRVLAFGWKRCPADAEELSPDAIEEGLKFAGLQGMMDPPRPEAIEAVAGCQRAGIRVVMITGDHPVTAAAIAARMGIAPEGAAVLTGREVEGMEEATLALKARTVAVFARVSPHHKFRIVEALKAGGQVVAVTGDGANDAPALKAAHVGIAMGKGGTDVARDVSDAVLADDNFASIFHAVREGRIVFDNIRKVVFFLIPTGVASFFSIAGTMVMGLPLPFVPAQLLWINLVTNGLQDVALAFEPGERGVLDRPPRDPREGIMSPLLVQRTVLVGALISAGVILTFALALAEGDSLEKARSVAVTTMVFFQFFQTLNSRSERESIFAVSPFSNRFLFFSMVTALLAQLAVLYVPALNWVFRTTPIHPADWARLLAVSGTVLLLVELDKGMRRRWGAKGRSAPSVRETSST